MPATKIAPSVLASDLGNLNCECQRMMDSGADWLHMDIMVRLYIKTKNEIYGFFLVLI